MARPSYNLLILSILFGICSAWNIKGTFSKKAEAAPDNTKKLATANNDLALKLHRRLAGESTRNIFFSPFSLSTAFGMLYYGTNGKTARELRKVLGYETANLSDELVHQTFHEYLTEYSSSNNSSSYALQFANAILYDKFLNITPTYKKAVQYLYQASVKEVNFMSETSQVLNEVNNWVSEKTNGKIDTLIKELDPSNILIMLNAVYFKGTWENQFQSNLTAPGIFFNNGRRSESKEVPMMNMAENLLYNNIFNIQAIELPYKENISMVVLLPNDRDGLESFEKNLTVDNLSSIRDGMEITKVNFTFPKFKLEYSREMSNDFKALGTHEIFNLGADFSGMTSNNISVSEVIHKAMLEVNEEGSEAGAATGTSWGRRRPAEDREIVVTADHPFMFVIIDIRSELILFLGHVRNL